MKPSPRIRRRMTAWYAASVLVLLLLALVTMRGIARRALAVQNDESVDRSIELVRSFFRAELTEYRQIDATISHIAGELVFAGMGLEFLRPDSTRFARARSPAERAGPRPPVRVIVAPLERTLAPGWRLRLAVSVADLHDARRRIDRATLVALPVMVALAALAGWLVTGRALRPMAEMADAVERIDASKPKERLPIADPQDELGRLGRRFNALLERLDAALAQQRRFLADAAHELRTPLARMLAESETRLSAPASSADRETVLHMREDLLRASSLVDELLQLARADAGGVDAVLAPAHLDDVVSDAVSPWEAEARRRGVRLSIAALEEAPAALDARLVSRLVGVLLHNALQYTPRDGTVEIRVTEEDGRATLVVGDSGVGIPPPERERVFERFYRGPAARQLVPEGSGLGLAIATWIVRQHGATITADASPLGGAQFTVQFPPRDRSRRSEQVSNVPGQARPAGG